MLTRRFVLPIPTQGGYPVSVDDMTMDRLVLFIPLIIKCSQNLPLDSTLGAKHRPSWWPKKVAFCNFPNGLTGPRSVIKNTLMDMIRKCYAFHGCELLLEIPRFHGYNLWHQDRGDGFTSFYSKTTNELVVSVKNDIKAYDVHLGRTETRYLRSPRRQSSCSSSVASRRGSLSPNSTPPPVGSPFRLLPASPAALPGDKPPAEVLCDFCSNSFDSQEFLNEHIKLTHRGGPVEEEEVTPKEDVEILYSTCNWRGKRVRGKTSAAFKQQVAFLSLLGLVPKTDGKHTEQEKLLTSPKPPAKLVLFGMNRLYRFPLSSPFGQQVFSRTNFMTMSSRISSMNREKADRHVNDREIAPRLLFKPEKGHNFPRVTNRNHQLFPRKPMVSRMHKTIRQKRNRCLTLETGLNRRSRQLFRRLRPCSVTLIRLPTDDAVVLNHLLRLTNGVCLPNPLSIDIRPHLLRSLLDLIPTPQNTPGAPLTPQNTSGAPVTPQNTPGAPLTPQNTAGAPVTPQNTSGAPLTPQNTSGAPVTPQNTSGAPLTPQNTSGAPLTPQNTSGAPQKALGTSLVPGNLMVSPRRVSERSRTPNAKFTPEVARRPRSVERLSPKSQLKRDQEIIQLMIQWSKMPRPSPRQNVVSPEPTPQSPPELSEESTEAPIVNGEGPPPILEEQVCGASPPSTSQEARSLSPQPLSKSKARKVKRPMPASVKLRYVNRPMPLTARKKLYRQLGICSTYGKPRRTTNSQRNNRKRELTRLLMDECKELKTQGFDPRSRRLKPRRRKGLVESKENECQTRGEEPPGPTEKEEPSHVVRKRRAPFGLEWAQEEASQVASRELRSLLKDECKELKRNLSPGATKSKYSTSVNVAALGPVSPKRLSLMSPSQRQLLSLALDADTTAATGAPGSAENMEEPLMTTDLDPSTMCIVPEPPVRSPCRELAF